MAAPFVEGRLRNENLAVEITTSCAHCAEPMRIRVDSELRYEVIEPAGAQPMLFEPHVDWSTFTEPNIIRRY